MLTKAGEIIYRQGKIISQLADKAVKKAEKIINENSYTLRVGSSLLNPCKPFMDLRYSVSEGKLLLNTECRKDIHPALVTLPVDWDYTIPYGLLYAKEPSAEARLFIDAVK